MNKARLAYLFKAYYNKTASEAERDELMKLLESGENDAALKSLLAELWEQHNSHNQPISESKGNDMLQAILQHRKPVTSSKLVWIQRVAAAAVLILFVAGGYFLLNRNKSKSETAQATKQIQPDPIVPGGNKAVLTLADGSNIVLDSTQQGTLVKQGNANVINSGSSVLTYDAGADNAQPSIFNTLSTPKGGQYRLVLTDGTRVWLNASSSIRFPVAFDARERHVIITGEAYFEVAKDPSKPFTVQVQDATVQVLGTHFNIMAYEDEKAIRTTLIEGSVKVTKGADQKILTPGQQAKMRENSPMKVSKVDIEEVLAWKNGWFNFASSDIEHIMRQIARWYDVEVVYEGKIPTGHYTGIVSRSNNISEALDIMRAGGVGFKIEGHKIIVLEGQ